MIIVDHKKQALKFANSLLSLFLLEGNVLTYFLNVLKVKNDRLKHHKQHRRKILSDSFILEGRTSEDLFMNWKS